MKILICGARGQLGSELSRLLRDGRAELGPIPEIYTGAEWVETDADVLDITDAACVQEFVSGGQFDLVINCAAMTNVDGCEEHEDTAFLVNATGAENLSRAAAMIGAKVVYLSTDYVFSGEEQGERVESDETGPQSAYGRTKLVGEQLVKTTNPKSFIVRTAWLYGYVGNNFVKTMMKLARENGSIKVVNDQFGNPTSANDLAYEILKIAETDNYGIYHCTNQGTCSWFEFASVIVDEAGISCEKIPCSTDEFPRPAKRPANSALKNQHLEETIGDEMRDWQDALAEYLNNLPQLEG